MRVAPALLLLLAACPAPVKPPPAPSWMPGVVYQTARGPTERGYLDRKGLIHAHSYFSHDACDGQPVIDGGYNEPCYEDFRRGLCQTKHDFVFLTDHPSLFTDNEYPDTLLYRADHGDQLVDHGAGPTANWLACPGADAPLIMAGTESSTMMPVGLERHVADRGTTYNADTSYALELVRDAGAVDLVAHTEKWSPEILGALPLDGFEMYNLHANTFKNGAVVLDYMVKVDAKQFDGLPNPDTFLASYDLEDPAYLETWGTVMARGFKRVTTMGTDCHRNSLPQITQDGESIDSYRRMMMAFSNHLLVKAKPDGSWDDQSLKDALRARRLYGIFDCFGTPQGFDFFVTEGATVKEIGDEVSLANGPVFSIKAPTLRELPSDVDAPTITVKLYKAREVGWDELASSSTDVSFTPTVPGAYRAEVRILPRHLKKWIGNYSGWLKAERPWVYTNVITVVP
jgi:hypothetical protein